MPRHCVILGQALLSRPSATSTLIFSCSTNIFEPHFTATWHCIALLPRNLFTLLIFALLKLKQTPTAKWAWSQLFSWCSSPFSVCPKTPPNRRDMLTLCSPSHRCLGRRWMRSWSLDQYLLDDSRVGRNFPRGTWLASRNCRYHKGTSLTLLYRYLPGHIHAFYLEYVYYERREQAREGRFTATRAPGVYSDRVQAGGQSNYGTIPQHH